MIQENNYFIDKESAEIVKRVLTAEDVKWIANEIRETESAALLIIKGKRKTTKSNIHTVLEKSRERVDILRKKLR